MSLLPEIELKNDHLVDEHEDEEDHDHEHEHDHTQNRHHPHRHSAHRSTHHHGKRMLHFIHPLTGKLIHVVTTPQDMEQKRLDLMKEAIQEDFGIYLHGSVEHVAAIRDLHAHHESRRQQLRDQNLEIYQQFENVKNELDTLSAELHLLTDHNVALDASFDKFGYSAHLRTTDGSETASLNSDHESINSKHLDRSAESLKFFRRPQLRQYFHKGLLWRSSRKGEVAAFELFVDLVYVGTIDVVGKQAVEHPSGLSILHFVIIFSIAWKIWADLTLIVNWFHIDDIFQRLAVLFYLTCLFAFTLNIAYFFDGTYTMAISFYMTQRLFTAFWYVIVSFLVPMVRGTVILSATCVFISAVLWIGSIHVDWPRQLALIFPALIIDIFGGILILWVQRTLGKKNQAVAKRFKEFFEFCPAVNIEHRVERTNSFTALVFGYSVLTILFQNRGHIGINGFFAKGIMGLTQAYIFNWIYFEIDGAGLHVHAIRRHWFSSIVWSMAHLPFIMSYVLAAATLSQLVLAHDCTNTNANDLGDEYVDNSVAHVNAALRWYYCVGLGISLISMGAISLSHVHKRLPRARFRKRPRLAVRTCVGITIMFLPLAKQLTSMDLIAITTSLIALVLILDLFGNSCEGDQFWRGGMCKEYRRNQCTYTANCKLSKRARREIQKAVAKGDKVGLDDLFKRRSSSMTSLDSSMTRAEEWHSGHY